MNRQEEKARDWALHYGTTQNSVQRHKPINEMDMKTFKELYEIKFKPPTFKQKVKRFLLHFLPYVVLFALGYYIGEILQYYGLWD